MDLIGGHVLQGRWQIDRTLAHGGSSVIYVGHPLHGAGRVAIKQLRPPSEADREDDIRQFRREYELLGSLHHPALPRALAFFEEDGTWYLVEELVAGRTMRDVMTEEQRLPWPRAVEVTLALLEVLAWLHRHGVVYRDLQPANVLLASDNSVRLIDLGAARRWRPDALRDTVLLGTPGFAAPEQYGFAQTDGRADIYSIGVMLHHMLSGREPDGQAWQFEAPRQLVADVPPHVDEAVMRAVAMQPAQRFQTAEEMAVALRGFEPGRPQFKPHGPPRLRLQYRGAWSYFGRDFPSRIVGPSITALAVPAFLTSAVLWPVPLVVGTGLGLFTTLPAHLAWRRWRTTVAEIYDNGIRVFDHGIWWTAAWDSVQRVRCTLAEPDGRLLHAQISEAQTAVDIAGDWPGLPRLVQEVATRAGLIEDKGPKWRDSYVGTVVRTYARPVPLEEDEE